MRKKGNMIVTYPIVMIVCIFCIVIIGMFFINSIIPFIWYQKLNTTVQKYMFVVEKFGYLTSSEKNDLFNELTAQGFESDKIKISVPSSPKSYGELVNLTVEYEYNLKNIVLNNLNVGYSNKIINLKVSKNSYSKV